MPSPNSYVSRGNFWEATGLHTHRALPSCELKPALEGAFSAFGSVGAFGRSFVSIWLAWLSHRVSAFLKKLKNKMTVHTNQIIHNNLPSKPVENVIFNKILRVSIINHFSLPYLFLASSSVEGLGSSGRKTNEQKDAVQNELVQIFGAPCWGGGVTP